MTIAAIAALLVLKSGILLQVAVTHGAKPDGVIVTAANAASTDQLQQPHAKPAALANEHKASLPTTSSGLSPSGPSEPPKGPPPVSDSEKALLQDLRQRRQDLDARSAAIDSRQSLLAAAEQKLTARVAELQALQTKLEGLDAAQKQKEEAGWQSLVKLYEVMKPKEAAIIFNDLSMSVLVQLMDRMKDVKAAAVMGAMNPDKARDLTAEMARARTGHDVPAAPIAGLKNNSIGG